MASTSEGPTDLNRFAWFCLEHLLIILITILLWMYIWLKRIGIEMPIDKSEQHHGTRTFGLFFTTKQLNIFWKLFYKAITNFDDEYWVKICGLDGFLYLKFQRSLFKMIFVVSMISMFLSFAFNLTSDSSLQIADPKWRNDWMVKVLYGNKDMVKDDWSWVQVFMYVFITIATMHTVYKLKNLGRRLYNKYNRSGLMKHDFEWLKSRTIHVRGLLKNDVDGVLLENVLSKHLKNTDSKILGTIVVPDYKKLTELEEYRKDYEDLSHLLGVKAPI